MHFSSGAFFSNSAHPKFKWRSQISDEDLWIGILNSRWDTTNILSHASNHFGTRSNRYFSFGLQIQTMDDKSRLGKQNIGQHVYGVTFENHWYLKRNKIVIIRCRRMELIEYYLDRSQSRNIWCALFMTIHVFHQNSHQNA